MGLYIWFKTMLLSRTVDIKLMLTILKLQKLEWKQHAYRILFLACTFVSIKYHGGSEIYKKEAKCPLLLQNNNALDSEERKNEKMSSD